MTQQPHNTSSRATFTLIRYFISVYPLRCVAVLVALIIAGTIEIIGISALLPLLNLILEKDNANPNILTQMTQTLFDVINITPSFTNLLFVIVIAISAKAFITFQAMRIVAYAAADITRDFRIDLINSLLKAKWQYYSLLPVGKSANAISAEAESTGQFYILIGKAFSSFVQASLYILIALLVDWKFSLLAIVLGGLGAFLLKFLIRHTRIAAQEYTGSLKSLLGRLTESLSGAKALKAMGQEGRFTDLLNSDTQNINLARKKTNVANLALTSIHEPMLVIFIATGLFVMFHFTDYPITGLLLIAFLFHRLIGYVNQVQANYQKTTAFEAAAISILDATKEAKENAETMDGNTPPSFENTITFNDVTLTYGENVICQSFNDTIPAHKITVLFGPSGTGKSTMIDAVLGFINPKQGTVKIDNDNLADLDIKAWRQNIGYVPQETYLFHDTIFKNITLGNPDISEEDAINALKKANAWEFIQNIEDGIHHIVGERGTKLSGGQRQRIALARALATSPKLLILDEATTGLDQQSEDHVFNSIQNMLPDITVIAISHNPNILNLADHVIKLGKEK